MKRCKIHTLLDLSNNLVSNELTAYEFFSAVYDPMADSLDILECRKNTMLLVKKCLKDSLNTYSVVCNRHFLYKLFLTGSLMLYTSYFHSDSLYETLCKKIINFFVLHIKKLIFQ